MIEEDYEQYKICFPKWAKETNTICLLSPNNEQKNLFNKLFPESEITIP